MRQSPCARDLEPVRSGRLHPSDEVVRQLGGGQVTDAGQQPGLDKLSIARPPVPVAWKTSTSYPRSVKVLRLRRLRGW